MGALFSFFHFTQNGNLKACFYVSSSLAILMLYSVPLFPSPSLPVAFFTFSFLFGITKLERWVYFLLFFPFILLSLD